MNAVSNDVLDLACALRPASGLDCIVDAFLASSDSTRLSTSATRYWSEMHRVPLDARRAWHGSVRRRVRQGELDCKVLALLALGEADSSLVYLATQEYLRQGPVTLEQHHALVSNALEWVCRGLALNRAAAFAALAALGDQPIHRRLSTVRLSLELAEVTTICTLLAEHAVQLPAAFLGDWLELLSQPPAHAAAEPVAALLSRGTGQGLPRRANAEMSVPSHAGLPNPGAGVMIRSAEAKA